MDSFASKCHIFNTHRCELTNAVFLKNHVSVTVYHFVVPSGLL